MGDRFSVRCSPGLSPVFSCYSADKYQNATSESQGHFCQYERGNNYLAGQSCPLGVGEVDSDSRSGVDCN